MKIQRWCKTTQLNWAALPDLKSRIEQLGVAIKSEEVTLHRSPDSVTYDSLQNAADAVRQHGVPHHYELNVWGMRDDKRVQILFNRTLNLRNQEILTITGIGIEDSKSLDTLTEFLGLVPIEPLQAPPVLRKTGFIAHRFDEHGTKCAERVSRFLELLGFAIVTGRAYSPRPVTDKVRGRITAQELLFAILTPGTDDTWLTQEPIVGECKDKPLFLLKQEDFDYKPGLLGDREYIPFPPDYIEATFTPILEGLRDLGYNIQGKV
jgi:hypothetical protein